MSKTTGWAVVIVLLVLLGTLFYWAAQTAPPTTPTLPDTDTTADTNSPIATALYTCDNGKQIAAAYYNGTTTATPAPGQPPMPTGTVDLAFSDGSPSMELNQTISADGARYSDGDPQIAQGQPGAESFVFWNKGNSALIMQDGQNSTVYTNCQAPQQS